MIEFICAILGLAQGVLAWLNKRSNWIVYTLMMVFLVIFSATNNLWADVVQNTIYAVICLYSYFILWNKGSDFAHISKMNNTNRIWTIVIISLATIIVGMLLKGTNDPLPMIDAFTTVTTFAALILMSYHKLECWIVWLINDIAYIVQYYMLPDQAWYLIFLYIIWTGFAVGSLMTWRKQMITNS